MTLKQHCALICDIRTLSGILNMTDMYDCMLQLGGTSSYGEPGAVEEFLGLPASAFRSVGHVASARPPLMSESPDDIHGPTASCRRFAGHSHSELQAAVTVWRSTAASPPVRLTSFLYLHLGPAGV